MTNKFCLYDIAHGSFYTKAGRYDAIYGDRQTEPGLYGRNNLENAAIFSEATAKEILDSQDKRYWLQIPLYDTFVEHLPFVLHDTDPDLSHSSFKDAVIPQNGKALICTEIGFYGDSNEFCSRETAICGFHLEEATLYDMEILRTEGTPNDSFEQMAGTYDCPRIFIPVTEEQQEEIKKLDFFTPAYWPYGLFQELQGNK